MRWPIRFFFPLALVLSLAGCGRPWVVAHQGIVSAHSVNHAAYSALDAIRDTIVEQTRAQLVAEYDGLMAEYAECRTQATIPVEGCGDPGEPAEWLEDQESRITAYRRALDATRTVDGALVQADEAVVSWSQIRGDDPPAQFRQACTTLGNTFPEVLAGLRRFNVDYPEQLDMVGSVLGPICLWSVDLLSPNVATEPEEVE